MKIGDTIEINGATVMVDKERSFGSCSGCNFHDRGDCLLEHTKMKYLMYKCIYDDIIYTKIENTSGLTDHELKLEKIVDKIRAANTTIDAICVLKDSINEIIM